jgi:hypothetical protein
MMASKTLGRARLCNFLETSLKRIKSNFRATLYCESGQDGGNSRDGIRASWSMISRRIYPNTLVSVLVSEDTCSTELESRAARHIFEVLFAFLKLVLGTR